MAFVMRQTSRQTSLVPANLQASSSPFGFMAASGRAQGFAEKEGAEAGLPRELSELTEDDESACSSALGDVHGKKRSRHLEAAAEADKKKPCEEQKGKAAQQSCENSSFFLRRAQQPAQCRPRAARSHLERCCRPVLGGSFPSLEAGGL